LLGEEEEDSSRLLGEEEDSGRLLMKCLVPDYIHFFFYMHL